ncbi:MAG: hypothetical protein GX986_05910 [Firmicutes bacterium]|nr:hypothetical protein [Bacillota bacterium]
MYQLRSSHYEHQPMGLAQMGTQANQGNMMGNMMQQNQAMMCDMHRMCNEMNNRLSMMQNTLEQVHNCVCGCQRKRR